MISKCDGLLVVGRGFPHPSVSARSRGQRPGSRTDQIGAPIARKATTRKATFAIDEAGLTKGEVRKLNALRKSLGDTIADRAFAQWLRQKAAAKAAAPVDQNAELIANTLLPLAKARKLRIPRGGYLVKRGRGRVIVSRAAEG